MATYIDDEIQNLKRKLHALSSLVEQSLRQSLEAWSNSDVALAREVIELDRQIDLSEVEIEETCLKILARYQSVAQDLRYIIGVLKINNDMERIADLSANIARRVKQLGKLPPEGPPIDFTEMGQKTLKMYQQAITALVDLDQKKAEAVRREDDDIDNINRENYRIVFRAVKENPDGVEALFQYLSVSRYLERVADYITNIAEDIIYMVEGDIIRHRPHHS